MRDSGWLVACIEFEAMSDFRMVAVAVVLGLAAGCGGGNGTGGANPVAPIVTSVGDTQTDSSTTPSNLALPIDLSAINLRGVINPYGVVRSSLDEGGTGHPGIDLPSNTGASFYAVADGRIVSITPVTEEFPGFAVKLLIAEGATAGTGWIFLYEHMVLVAGLAADSQVTRGQRIGSNPLEPAITNHLELSWAFNNYEFLQNQTCWVPQLDAGSESTFMSAFNNDFRTDQRFIDAWTMVTKEGLLPFSELLNTERFPDGARPCYPPGTDVRVEP